MPTDTKLEKPEPFSPQAKEALFKQLKNSDPKHLESVLIDAAIYGCHFPINIHKELSVLQSAHRQHYANPAVKEPLEAAIKAYITTTGITQFKLLLQAEFIESDWKSGFLRFLVWHLKLQHQPEPIVEATIREGKVYWRIIQDTKMLYANYGDFDFAHSNPWRMSWEQFRLFKDSGKRGGTVAITKERFVLSFQKKYHEQADAVWEELTVKGVLNKKNRLSHSWRALTGEELKLNSLEDPIKLSDIRDCLKELSGKNKQTAISRNTFIKYWKFPFKSRAGLIWDKLKEMEVLDKENKWIKSTFAIAAFLETIHLTYSQVINKLNKIANDQTYQGSPPNLPEMTIFRPERTPKGWANSSGSVTNYCPSDNVYCTKLWDVGIYSDLGHHRNTENEEQLNKDTKLNYDHIPSADFLKNKGSSLLNELETQLEIFEVELTLVKENLDSRIETLTKKSSSTRITRGKSRDLIDNDEVIENLRKQCTDLEELIKQNQQKQNQIQNELGNKHGEAWWTIAIPAKLHNQGATFMLSSKEQQKITEHPFLYDLKVYLNILRDEAHKFALTLDDYIKALGAFRTLYRRQVKPPIPISGKYTTGTIPQTFFNDAQSKQDIDDLLNKEVNLFLEEREDIKPAEVQDKQQPSAKKKLDFQ